MTGLLLAGYLAPCTTEGPHLNESSHKQLQIDFRTGTPTSFRGQRVTADEWLQCTYLNSKRASRIKETAQQAPSREQVSADVWLALVARESLQRDVPLVDFSRFGLQTDDLGMLYSTTGELERVGEGKEATAWRDTQTDVVYKFFDLREDGHLGQKLELCSDEAHGCAVEYASATLPDILDKLAIIHEAGGCPTEIVGLADTGDFLIAKQPYCLPYKDIAADRRRAVENAKAVMPTGSYRQTLWVVWALGQPWLLGDLHTGNIMRDRAGTPLIIDAHIGTIPDAWLRSQASLSHAIQRAHTWRSTHILPSTAMLSEGSDDEL